MEIRDWIMIISVLVIIFGWFYNNNRNREHEISKKKLEHRLRTLESFLPIYNSFASSKDPFNKDKDLTDKILRSRSMFQTYGEQDEWDLFKNFAIALDKKNIKQVEDNINKLSALIRSRIRKELDITNINL
ncbi:hypothetical protein [Sulfurimonas sp.]|uniref:hypothetical protein n=1 Tax=Sulfurimonas sp. TaxID=2022749 RepID=UPI0025D23668|nr:hypothetical protein [Sulfurimonas sp.]